MSDETNIDQALLAKLQSFDFDQQQIAWPNRHFVPTPNTAFLRPTNLRSQTLQATLGSLGANHHAGLLQIDVFWPINDGIVNAGMVADALITHYALGTRLTYDGQTVRVTAPPYRGVSAGPLEQDENWYHVPVIIPWEAYTQNPL